MASVTMTHPDIPADPATATRQQFELLWKDRGWQEAKAEGAAPAEDGAKRRKSAPTTPAVEPASTSKEN